MGSASQRREEGSDHIEFFSGRGGGGNNLFDPWSPFGSGQSF